MSDHVCAENLSLHLNTQILGDTNIKYLEVKGACQICGKAMKFRGPPGINPAAPTIAIDGSEAVLPFLFDGEEFDGKATGYSVTFGGTN